MASSGRSPFDLVRSIDNEQKAKSPSKSPRGVTNKTQKVALALLQQEEKNAVRGRLESLLQQQFLRKYGSKNPGSEINGAIKSKIKEFVSSFDDIRKAEAAIGSLEVQIKETVVGLKNAIVSAKAARAAAKNPPRVPGLAEGFGKNTRSDPEIDPNSWPVVNAVMMVEAEQKRLREEEMARQKKQKYQDELSRQIEKNNQLKQKAKDQREVDLQGVQKNLSSYEQEQARIRHQREETLRLEREMREAQIEENKRKKEEERQARIAQEQGEMARAKRIASEEEEERRLLKLRQKQAQDNLKVENEHNKALKAEALRQRQEYEKKLNADYEAKLAREEEARANAFQARMDALASFSKSYESRVGRTLQQQKEESDKIINANLAESDRKRAERDRTDLERRKMHSMQNTEYNIAMMEKKKQDQENERLDAIARRLRMEQEAGEAKRRDRENAEKKRIQMLELKQQLDQQVAQRQHGERNLATLSSIEATINKSITKKLAEDPTLKHKVVEVVRPLAVQSSRSDNATGRKGNNIFF